jgi:hypothetical protein
LDWDTPLPVQTDTNYEEMIKTLYTKPVGPGRRSFVHQWATFDIYKATLAEKEIDATTEQKKKLQKKKN